MCRYVCMYFDSKKITVFFKASAVLEVKASASNAGDPG